MTNIQNAPVSTAKRSGAGIALFVTSCAAAVLFVLAIVFHQIEWEWFARLKSLYYSGSDYRTLAFYEIFTFFLPVISAILTFASVITKKGKKQLFGAALLLIALYTPLELIFRLINGSKIQVSTHNVAYFAEAVILLAAAIMFFVKANGMIPTFVGSAALSVFFMLQTVKLFIPSTSVRGLSLAVLIATYAGFFCLSAAFILNALRLRKTK